MDRTLQQINQMMSLIMDSSHQMPDYVFHYYVDSKKRPNEKIFYNLIADSYLTLFSYCKLMFENAWSQAFALLRMGLEQIAAIFQETADERGHSPPHDSQERQRWDAACLPCLS